MKKGLSETEAVISRLINLPARVFAVLGRVIFQRRENKPPSYILPHILPRRKCSSPRHVIKFLTGQKNCPRKFWLITDVIRDLIMACHEKRSRAHRRKGIYAFDPGEKGKLKAHGLIGPLRSNELLRACTWNCISVVGTGRDWKAAPKNFELSVEPNIDPEAVDLELRSEGKKRRDELTSSICIRMRDAFSGEQWEIEIGHIVLVDLKGCAILSRGAGWRKEKQGKVLDWRKHICCKGPLYFAGRTRGPFSWFFLRNYCRDFMFFFKFLLFLAVYDCIFHVS